MGMPFQVIPQKALDEAKEAVQFHWDAKAFYKRNKRDFDGGPGRGKNQG